MEMTAVVDQMLVMLILLLIGILCARIGLIDAAFNRKLSFLVLNVAQVASILAAAMNVGSDVAAGQLLAVLGLSLLVILFLYALSFVFPLCLRAEKAQRGVWQFMATFGNFGFMGFPVVSALLGAKALFYNSLFLIPMFLLTYSLGIVLITGGGKGGFRLKTALLCPPLLASLAAILLVLTRVKAPAFLVTAANTLGGMTTPGAMLVVGASLGMMSLREVLGDWKMYVFAVARLLIAPVLVWLLLRPLVRDALVLRVMVLMAAMPAATNTTMLSLQYGGDEKVASRGVFLSTVFSFLTIPLLVWLLL